MTRGLKDVVATGLTVMAVLAFLAAQEGWGVWLIGDSRRWAAGAIALLGIATCGLGSPGKDKATKFLATLGVLAFVLAILALATGSLTPMHQER
jgi:peptidoglycan/LPS O-acetylase OafA/YrhL